ncbi:Cu(I)-responsive transcriptional regulator [Vibrio tritonius]|uniref:HTH-type transcriptional regulator CueR n=1 Tax=Vibrio tritonius TaxID=1435069 RepID=A0ABS7YQH6_9VIBR|nr:Cu(I)-responsive transcriptional regulator [Vibrio tritonius]MCA2016494.1 Cu(I)-responsive transcriptional regulator [Vibrio tritonius]
MNISEVAEKTGLTAKSIRLYEEKGLIAAPVRADNGYRTYQQHHIDDLLLIARCKRVGFSLDECKAMLMLANDPTRQSKAVKQQAQLKLEQVTKKLNELRLVQQQLQEWVNECPGDENSECPIIEDLKGHCCHCSN